jgi:hypothetical protein
MHLLATLVIVVASTVVSQGITSASVPNPGRSSPTRRIKVQEISPPLRLRSLWCKYAKVKDRYGEPERGGVNGSR